MKTYIKFITFLFVKSFFFVFFITLGLVVILNILSELDLLKMANKKPDEMSGGERQRVSVARSLMNSPKIVFADEPSGNLDSENSKTLYNLFYEVRKKIGCSFLIVTHDLKIADMSDRKIVLKDGKIINES